MTRSIQRWLVLGSLAVIVVSMSTAVTVVRVQAQSEAQAECPNETFLGRRMCEGFLSGRQRTYGENQNVFYDGLRPTNVNEFVSSIRGYLYDDDRANNPGSYWADVRDNDKESNNAGAATIIAVMLNKNGSDFNNINQGVSWAKTNFARWEALVRDHNARGRVQWNVNAVSNDSQGNRVKHTSGDKPSDDNYFLRTYFFTTQVIRFTGDNGAYFQIQRDCGNIFGLLGRLTEPSSGTYRYEPFIVGDGANPQALPNNGSSTSAVSAVTRGQVLKFDVSVRNQSDTRGVQSRLQGKMYNLDPNPGQPFNYNDPGCGGSCYNNPSRSTAPQRGIVYDGGAGILYNPQNNINTPALDPGQTHVGPPNSTQAAPRSFLYTVPADAPVGRKICFYAHIDPGGPRGEVPLTNFGGLCYIVATNSGPPTTPPPTSPPPPSNADAVVTQPYFRVRGGDVSTGAGMSIGGVCTAPNFRAGVVGWNRGPTNAYGGAGTQYAAFVLNHLQEFATAQGSTAGPNIAAAPSGLAFANTAQGEIDVNAGLYGGKYAGADCVIDHFAGSTNVQNGDRLLSNLPEFPAGGAIPNGARLTYYVDGDLFIDSNVRFSGAYGNVNEIPSFAVIVKGDILIQNSVAQLDGVYIAQPTSQTSTDGVIYTCATDNTPPFMSIGLTLGLHDACNAALTVNGSLTARQVWLMRSFGALDGEPAETINYIPELWLATQGAGGNFKSAGYDSITSLPPVL